MEETIVELGKTEESLQTFLDLVNKTPNALFFDSIKEQLMYTLDSTARTLSQSKDKVERIRESYIQVQEANRKLEMKCAEQGREYEKLLTAQKDKIREISSLKKSLADKEKVQAELQSEVDKQRADIRRANGEIQHLSGRVAEMEAESLELKRKCDRVDVLEDTNKTLKDTIDKLAQEYTRDLTEIANNYQNLTKSLSENTEHEVSKTAVQMFESIENMDQAAQKGLPEIARNCLKLLLELVKPPEPLPLEEDPAEVKEEGKEEEPTVKRTFTSSYIPVLEAKNNASSFLSVYSGRSGMGQKNPHAREVALGHGKGYMVQVYSPYTKKTTDYFDPYLQHGGKSIVRKDAKKEDPRLAPKYKLVLDDPSPVEGSQSQSPNSFRERPGWRSVREYFEKNDNPSNRTPSPAKLNPLLERFSHYS